MFHRKIDRLFQRAREQFFPSWDLERQWEIVAGRRRRHRGESGYCSSRDKRIYIAIDEVPCPDDGLLALIIHEVCHGVCNCGHTERWLEEMANAGRTAEDLYDPALARKIYSSAYAEIPCNRRWREKWCKRLYPLIYERG